MQTGCAHRKVCRLAGALSVSILGSLLLAGQVWSQAAPPLPGGSGGGGRPPKVGDLPAVTSASPGAVKLEAGGDQVLATLKGSRMELITGAYAYLNGQLRPEVSVGLKYVPGAALPRRGLTVVARQGAPAGEYELRLDVDGYLMALPTTVFKIVVGDVAPPAAPQPPAPSKAEAKVAPPPPPSPAAESPTPVVQQPVAAPAAAEPATPEAPAAAPAPAKPSE